MSIEIHVDVKSPMPLKEKYSSVFSKTMNLLSFNLLKFVFSKKAKEMV